MNNIEKLAIEHVQFNGDCEGHELYCFTKEQLEAFAKALQQSSEPVAKVLFRHDEDGLEPISFYSNDEAPSQENLKDRFVIMDVHLTPPSTVPVDKYNKLLDGITNALYQDLNNIKPYLRKLIAEAEAKS